ncbi:pilin [Patescibacteria group bacterium]
MKNNSTKKPVAFVLLILLICQFAIIGFASLKPVCANAQTESLPEQIIRFGGNLNNDVTTPKISVPVGDIKTGDEFATMDKSTWLGFYIAQWFHYVVGGIGIIAVMMAMYGGILWITSGGNAGQIDKAKGKIKNAVLGVFLLLISYTLFNTINPELLNLTLPKMDPMTGKMVCCENLKTKVRTKQLEKCSTEEKDLGDLSLCGEGEMPKITRVCRQQDGPPPPGIYNTNTASGAIDPNNSCGHFNYEKKCMYIVARNGICVVTEKNGDYVSGKIEDDKILILGEWRYRYITNKKPCGDMQEAVTRNYIGSNCPNNTNCWAIKINGNNPPQNLHCE